jgi:cytochrome c553
LPYAEKFASTCAPCHGERGMSTLALVPHLAGQPSFYAITQLFLFRDGRRDNALMSAVAKGMSDADLRAYSDLIGRLPWVGWPSAVADGATAASTQDANQFVPQPVPARMARGAALAQRLHCTGCHGADLVGGKQVPRLAGQREDYLAQALAGFRAATRVGYTPAMTEALAGTQADELDDLAHYLAHLGASAASPGQPPAGR